jgi:hypothetical protein
MDAMIDEDSGAASSSSSTLDSSEAQKEANWDEESPIEVLCDLATPKVGAELSSSTQQPEETPSSPHGRPLMQDLQLQAECLPFLQWMCQPQVTQVEALVKVSTKI